MVKFFEGINLTFKHLFFWLSLDGFDVDDFNGDWLFIFFIDAPVNNGAEAFADDVFQTIRIVFDFFSKVIIGIELPIHCSEFMK